MRRIPWMFGLIAMALIISQPSHAQQWAMTYGGSHSESDCSIQQTSDGGYVVVGRTYSFGAGSSDFWVLKLDSDGTVGWEKAYGGSSFDDGYSIKETFNQQGQPDGYIVSGTTSSFGSEDFWVLRLDLNGTVAWEKSYDLGLSEISLSIQQTSDAGFVVAGYTAERPALQISGC